MSNYIIGITGASGSIYGYTMILELLRRNHNVHVIFSHMGKEVFQYEMDYSLENFLLDFPAIKIEDNHNLFSPIASGSFDIDGMFICPCSMGTLGKIASSIGDTLLTRCADVTLKERRPLILIPRESPFHAIHLENMLKVTQSGGIILPPCPSFYRKPKTIDDIVYDTIGHSLNLIGIKNELYTQWER